MSSNPLPSQQHISGVSAQNGAQVAVGNFYGDVQFGSAENPQKAYEQKVSACRNALFVTNPHVDREKLISMKGTRVDGTCEWITQNKIYQSWLHGDAPLLWIWGGPGKGKTMLSIFLTEDLERITQDMGDAELVFNFCSHQDEKRNTAVAILRGLVHQIITKRPKLVKLVLPYFETPEQTQQTISSLETLWIIFKRLIQDPDLGTMFCVLDGLDESDEDTLRLLIPKLIDIFSPKISPPTTKAFKLVIVSRDIVGLRGCLQVKLDPDNEEQVAGDIERFVSNEVRKLSRIEGFDEFRATVQSTLLERSQGTFLWVGFVANELSQKRTFTEVLETLENLPSGLPAIYDRILLQVKSEHRRTSSLILRWVAMAFRPLTLQELAAAIGIQPYSPLITTERAIRDGIALCGPFLKVQGQEVGLVHQSARDYLLRKECDSNSVLEEFRIKPETSHFELARNCFDCVTHSDLQYGPLDVHDQSCQRKSPLLNYAVIHWPGHARCCSALATELFDRSKPFFAKNSDLRDNWWRAYRRDRFRPELSSLPLLHTACHLGIVPWVRALFKERAWYSRSPKPVDEKDGDGCAALHWAAQGGYEVLVQLLLDRGANVNTTNIDGQTALDRAAFRGHETVVRLLLDHRADVSATDKSRDTPLHQSALGGHEGVVRLLLDEGANVNAANKVRQTALHRAASEGHEAVVRILVHRGANINAMNYGGRTALHHAASKGYEAVLRFLLDHGAPVNQMNIGGQTALHMAAIYGHEVVLRLLIDRGANARATDKARLTPLHLSALGGHETVAQTLIDHGVNVNATSIDGQTALHQAASGGHEAVANFLLDHGANVNATDKARQTALYIAAINGDEVVVRLLLDHGANFNMTNKDGLKMLGWAASNGHVSMVRLILDRGANVNATVNDGWTALGWAASTGHEAMVQLLLDCSANVNAIDKYGWTALHWAASGGHEMVVKLLLYRGADVQAKDSIGRTALHWATSEGHAAVVKLLN